MSFKFGFELEPDSEDNLECNIDQYEITENDNNHTTVKDSTIQNMEIQHTKEIFADWDSMTPDLKQKPIEFIIGSDKVLLKCVCLSAVEEDFKMSGYEFSSMPQALKANTDLIPKVYEGGLKIWECSIDLTEYLSKMKIDLSGSKILELGCGAGLPGLFALTHNALEVHFQDYNDYVIRQITIPNVALNSVNNKELLSRSRFFSGDWEDFVTFVNGTRNDRLNEKYDLIISSETIYSCDSYQNLHGIMAQLLKPGGKILIAAKTCYFGVGGGMRDFEQYVRNQDLFEFIVVKKITEGVQREILQMTFKSVGAV